MRYQLSTSLLKTATIGGGGTGGSARLAGGGVTVQRLVAWPPSWAGAGPWTGRAGEGARQGNDVLMVIGMWMCTSLPLLLSLCLKNSDLLQQVQVQRILSAPAIMQNIIAGLFRA